MQRGILAVQTDPRTGEEGQFNAWYDQAHVPEILSTEGFILGRRFRAVSTSGTPNGAGDWSKYLAIYDIASADIAASYQSLLERFRSGTMTAADHVSADPPYRAQLFEEILRLP
jgi:hypothetical protein